MATSWVYGIDFGTSNSLLCPVADNQVLPPLALDPSAKDPTVLKSVMYTPVRDRWFFGQEAISQYMQHLGEGRLLRSIKKYLPEASFESTTIHHRSYNLTELIGVFLAQMRSKANAIVGQDVRKVVLGRPAVFAHDPAGDQLAERRLEKAARLAGFDDIAFCPEPVAAAYEFRHQLHKPQKVLIADFGGGTSDYTILTLGPEAFHPKDVHATYGTPAAGDRLDSALMKALIAPHFGSNLVYRMPLGSVDLRLPKHLVQKMCSPADIGFLSQKDVLQLLKDAQRWSLDSASQVAMDRLFAVIGEHLGYQLFRSIEATKIALSKEPYAEFNWEYPGLDLNITCAATDHQAGASEVIRTIIAALDETLNRAQLSANEIDIVCCTGGTANHPSIIGALADRFGQEKITQHRSFHAVVMGLGEHALRLVQDKIF